jgi:hypothetical protein
MSDEVKFRLEEGSNGSVTLEAFDAKGDLLKSILSITGDGRLHRYGSAQVPGLQVDDAGRIIDDD